MSKRAVTADFAVPTRRETHCQSIVQRRGCNLDAHQHEWNASANKSAFQCACGLLVFLYSLNPTAKNETKTNVGSSLPLQSLIVKGPARSPRFLNLFSRLSSVEVQPVLQLLDNRSRTIAPLAPPFSCCAQERSIQLEMRNSVCLLKWRSCRI
jgi:hypothetical protein